MQVSGATDLASSKGQSASDCSNTKFKEEIEDSYPTDKTRCPCGTSLTTDSMIKVIPASYFSLPSISFFLLCMHVYLYTEASLEVVEHLKSRVYVASILLFVLSIPSFVSFFLNFLFTQTWISTP